MGTWGRPGTRFRGACTNLKTWEILGHDHSRKAAFASTACVRSMRCLLARAVGLRRWRDLFLPFCTDAGSHAVCLQQSSCAFHGSRARPTALQSEFLTELAPIRRLGAASCTLFSGVWCVRVPMSAEVSHRA